MKKPIVIGMSQRIPEIDSPCIIPAGSDMTLDDAIRFVRNARSQTQGKDYLACNERKVTHWDGTRNGIEILVLANVDTRKLSKNKMEVIKARLEEMAGQMDIVVDEIKKGGKRTQADVLLKCRKFDEWTADTVFMGLLPTIPHLMRLPKKLLVVGLFMVSVFSGLYLLCGSKGTEGPKASPAMIAFLGCMSEYFAKNGDQTNSELRVEIHHLLASALGASTPSSDRGKDTTRPKYDNLAQAFRNDLGVDNFEVEIEQRGVCEAGQPRNGMQYRPWAFVKQQEFLGILRSWFGEERQECSSSSRIILIRKGFYDLAAQIAALRTALNEKKEQISRVDKFSHDFDGFKFLTACRELGNNSHIDLPKGSSLLNKQDGPILPFFCDRDYEAVLLIQQFCQSKGFKDLLKPQSKNSLITAIKGFSRITDKEITDERKSASSAVGLDLSWVNSVYGNLMGVVEAGQSLAKAMPTLADGR